MATTLATRRRYFSSVNGSVRIQTASRLVMRDADGTLLSVLQSAVAANARDLPQEQILREGQARGELQFAGTPPAMAAVMFAALQGALQLARLDPDILLQIKTQLRALLNAPTDA